ncbi:MAG: hypothetical protein JNM27_23205 [Leptospirales bacterium]|nr:hypothetical protein [Leptospirales bacterium]
MQEHKVEWLNQSVRRSDGPILEATRQLALASSEPCQSVDWNGQTWYYGTGIRPADHPMRDEMRVLEYAMDHADCLFCEGKDVLVVALQGVVSPQSGDAYYDYEVKCNTCGKYSAVSYSED